MPRINLDAVLNPLPELKDHILEYIPRATTSKFGIVALGSGINIDALGRIYLDTQEYSDRLTAIETTAASTLETTVNTLETKAAELAASITQKLGTPNGIATLDSAGSIPSSQLPSYVDDILEYENVAAFPATGETGKIYVETTGNTTYRWSGATYVKITAGEVSSVAGKKGIVTLTKDDVGLSNVDNTNDLNKPLSTAAQTALTTLENKAKRGIINLYDASLIYGLNERVVLTSGDIVKSTIDGNTNDPNVDMAGWVNFEADQQIFNNKYSKFKQLETNSIEQELATRAKKKQYVGDYTSIQAAADAKRNNTTSLEIETNAQYTLASNLNLAGYTFIKGSGFYSRIKCVAGTGVVYSPTGVADDHAQRRIEDIQILGDGTIGDYLTPKNGTTIGYTWTGGAYAETSGVMFNGHDTGFKINNSYTNLNRYNYYRACKVGLHLKNVTSHREEMIYARFNSTSAVVIEGTMQNVTLAGGAIEGNRGIGIQVKNVPDLAFPKLTLDDLYMESNGDLNASAPAIDIQAHPHMHVDVRGGSYWNNSLSGIVTGAYRWGTSVSFNNSTLNGYHFAKTTRVVGGIDYAAYNSALNTAGATLLGYSEPTMMLDYSPTVRVDGFGPIFQVPFAGRTVRKFLQPNEITLTYPHVLSKSATTLLAENTSLDYGDGSWTDITFAATGSFNAEYAQLTNLIDASNEYIGKVFVFLLKPTTDCKIGIVTTGALNSMQSYFQLKANTVYRICMVHNRTGAGDFRTRLFSRDGACTIAYLPINLGKFKTTEATLAFANMFATGAL